MTDALAEVTSWVFADMADPREFLAKMSPTGSEMSTPGSAGAVTAKGRKRERKLAATGLAASSVATVGGGHAIVATLKENKGRAAEAKAGRGSAGKLARVAHISPSRAAEVLGAGWLGLHGVELTGDALALRAQQQKLSANKSRTKIAARAPGQLHRVELAKAGPVGTLKRVGEFAEHQRKSALMAAQRADIAKPLPPSPVATRATREKQIARSGDRANRRANLTETADRAKASVASFAANPHVQGMANTVAEGLRRASAPPVKAPLIRNPAATAAAGALAGGAAVAYSRRRPISARAPAEYVDLEFAGEICKVDTDKRQVFGWASISKVNGEPYVDRQGDWIPIEVTEVAAYDYVKNSRVGGDMHRRAGITKEFGPHKVATLIESFVVTPEKLAKMGLAPDALPEAWWIGMGDIDGETWGEIKSGKRTGFSVHGSGVRKDVTL